MTRAADLALGKIAALKTALIEFTDGDDAIAVADAGVVTLLTTAVAKSEGGAVTTNITQGLAKAWATQIDHGGGAIDGDTFNIASYVDTATGRGRPNMTNAMANETYTVIATNGGSGYPYQGFVGDTDTFETSAVNASGNFADGYNNAVIFGDLA